MGSGAKILVLDDEAFVVKAVERICKLQGWNVLGHTDHVAAAEAIDRWQPDVILLDVNMPVSGLTLLKQLKAAGVSSEFVVMTGDATIEVAITAMKEGAFDFVSKPFEVPEALTLKVERALEHAELARRVRMAEETDTAREMLTGNSPSIAALRKVIAKVAPTHGTVLITGETGVGKEMVARAIHAASSRAHKPFLAVNCAAFNENLIESELFGHEKGSFTGALNRRDGIFVEAHSGTLFLDEVGEMPLSLQAKLLRVLQEGEVRRLGSNSAQKVDVRLIAATNRDLQAEVKRGAFREDLYYRLNVINMIIEPLRKRRDDIALLAAHFLRDLQKAVRPEDQKRLSPKALEYLERYSWPGNVRELANVVNRALILAEGKEISPRALPHNLLDSIDVLGKPLPVRLDLGYQEAKQTFLEQFDKEYLSALLDESGGSLKKAAELAAMDRSNFRKLVLKSGIRTTDEENGEGEEMEKFK